MESKLACGKYDTLRYCEHALHIRAECCHLIIHLVLQLNYKLWVGLSRCITCDDKELKTFGLKISVRVLHKLTYITMFTFLQLDISH
jgi:hypothetical protein